MDRNIASYINFTRSIIVSTLNLPEQQLFITAISDHSGFLRNSILTNHTIIPPFIQNV